MIYLDVIPEGLRIQLDDRFTRVVKSVGALHDVLFYLQSEFMETMDGVMLSSSVFWAKDNTNDPEVLALCDWINGVGRKQTGGDPPLTEEEIPF